MSVSNRIEEVLCIKFHKNLSQDKKCSPLENSFSLVSKVVFEIKISRNKFSVGLYHNVFHLSFGAVACGRTDRISNVFLRDAPKNKSHENNKVHLSCLSKWSSS
jgi:hypothetical protein